MTTQTYIKAQVHVNVCLYICMSYSTLMSQVPKVPEIPFVHTSCDIKGKTIITAFHGFYSIPDHIHVCAAFWQYGAIISV